MPKIVTVEAGKDFPESADGWFDTRYARVGWSKATEDGPGVVQVATCHAAAGHTERSADGVSAVPGVLVTLDRAGVNRFVAALLRASDVAFPR